MTILLIYGLVAQQKHQSKPNFLKFCHQLYHVCLTKVFEPLKAGMTTPELIQCPNSHWHHAIYGLRPYIANYPEQVFLAGIVQNWCPKYVSILCYFLTAHSLSMIGATQSQIILMHWDHVNDCTRRPDY